MAAAAAAQQRSAACPVAGNANHARSNGQCPQLKLNNRNSGRTDCVRKSSMRWTRINFNCSGTYLEVSGVALLSVLLAHVSAYGATIPARAPVHRVAAQSHIGSGVVTLPCEYWLTEESDAGDYSELDVQQLGFQTNRSVSAAILCTFGCDDHVCQGLNYMNGRG